VMRIWPTEFNQIIDKDGNGANYFGMKIIIAHGDEMPDRNLFMDGENKLRTKGQSKIIIVTAPGSYKNHVKYQ
jgi:hypothetical protein